MNREHKQLDERAEQRVMLDQQLALSAYLQALLSPEPEVHAELAAAPVRIETQAALTGQVDSRVLVEMAAPVAAAKAPMSASAAVESVHPYPDWATSDFQCLLFRVAGLTLAMPLVKLNGVLPWDASLVTTMPGHKDWFLGVRSHLDQQVRLIDVAKVIVPQTAPEAEREFGKVILIGAGRWGLVCESIAEVVNLAPTAVKWRVKTGTRPWLAGTLIERMCALIDADNFAQMLGSDASPAA